MLKLIDDSYQEEFAFLHQATSEHDHGCSGIKFSAAKLCNAI